MSGRAVQSAEVTAWRNAVVAAYAFSGLAFASWVSRLPAIRNGLDLTPGTVGLLLLCMTVGSFISVSVSGLIVLRFGSLRTIRIGSIMVGCGLVLAGFGTSVLANPLAVAAGLAVIGLGTASWNTASNVEGAAVERAVRRHIMPRLHGAFSIGTVAGAGLGAWAAGTGIPVFWHLAVVGALVAGSVATAARWFRADITPLQDQGFTPAKPDTFEDPSTGPLPIIRPETASRKNRWTTSARSPRPGVTAGPCCSVCWCSGLPWPKARPGTGWHWRSRTATARLKPPGPQATGSSSRS